MPRVSFTPSDLSTSTTTRSRWHQSFLKAHDALDREVDKAMGAPRKLITERQRQEILFANYVHMTSN